MTYPAPGSAPANLPDVSDPATAPFWEAAHEHRLVAQTCGNCGDRHWPYVEICPKCWSTDQIWADTAPTGEVYSYVVYHRALDPTKKDEIPYVVGRVVTDDGPTYNVRLDVAPEEATVGMRVTACWDDVTDQVTLLRFRPA